jgi:formate hydrogenlyase subunit 4
MLVWFALLLFMALFLGLGATLGAPWLVLVPIVIAISAVIWLVISIASGSSPRERVRETPEPDLFGPGREDDAGGSRPAER